MFIYKCGIIYSERSIRLAKIKSTWHRGVRRNNGRNESGVWSPKGKFHVVTNDEKVVITENKDNYIVRAKNIHTAASRVLAQGKIT